MRELRELLDEATRDIPAGVAQAPLPRIRARAARRRILWPVGISGALSAVLAGAALAFTGSGAEPEPIPPIPVYAWSHAYATEGGRALTIYVYSPSRCETLRDLHASVSESGGTVTVTVTGDLFQPPDRGRVDSPILNVPLDRPLGERALRDGAQGEARPARGPRAHRDKVHAHVAGSEVRLLCGGEIPARPGAFYPATVPADCTDDMPVMRDETFGPVAPVAVVGSFSEALGRANNSPCGRPVLRLRPGADGRDGLRQGRPSRAATRSGRVGAVRPLPPIAGRPL